jgi:fatty-acyl-CoA synthase
MIALSSSILHWARANPDRIALTYGKDHITYAQLAERTFAATGALRSQGIGAGDMVALLMKNSAAFVELTLAISHLGAVLLPINYRLGKEEIDYILTHAEAKLVCVDDELKDNLPGNVARVVLSREQQFDTRLLDPLAEPVRDAHPVMSSDMFRLMYTSGTTDRPKGVIHSYDNFYWKTLDHICELGLTAEDRLLVAGPLYHVGAFDLPGFAVLLTGGSMLVMRDFDAEKVLVAIERERLTGAWLPPVMLNRLLALKNRGDYDVSSVRWVIGGGERTPVERIVSFSTLFKQGRYIDAYGLTETCSGDTMMQAGQEHLKIGSAGRPLAHVQIEIRDSSGNSLPAGETGEICLRGPKVTLGYWNDPERTRASFFGQWFRTGDMGYLDDDGFLFLVDRKKDMVISGGENVASSEVERVIYSLDKVEEAAVVGLPDEQWGERVVAVVVLREGETLTLAELQAYCRNKIGGFKIPKQLFVVDVLPRTASGKVLKRDLRELLVHQPQDTGSH